MENKKPHGGARPNAGRKTKRDEESLNQIFVAAVKQITGKEDEDEAKKELIVLLWKGSSRGQLFVSEHIFGKPKESLEITNTDKVPDLSEFTDEELREALKNDD